MSKRGNPDQEVAASTSAPVAKIPKLQDGASTSTPQPSSSRSDQEEHKKTTPFSAMPHHIDPTKVTEAFWVFCYPSQMPPYATLSTHGKWLVFKPKSELDKSWHEVRRAVEAGEFGEECTGAKCSTSRKHPDKPTSKEGVFMVYTTMEGVDEIGLMLIHKVKQTIRYKTEVATRSGIYAHKGDKNITCKTMYWNHGNPSFDKLK